MIVFPYHAISRAYTLGTPIWRQIQSGVAAMELANGVMRTREELGQAVYAIDLRLEGLSQADALVIWAFCRTYRASTFWWSDPKVGPFSTAAYETWECCFDPASPPQITPRPNTHDCYDASITLLPILPTVAVETLVAHYLMNDNAADTVVADATGNSHTGTASQNTSSMTIAGKLSTALTFNSTTDYVNITDHADLRLIYGGTLMAWINPASLGESSGGRVIDKSSSSSVANGYALYLAATNAIACRVNGDTAAVSGNNAITLSTWQHVAAVISSWGRAIYVNGVAVSITGGSGTGLPPDVSGDVRIGQRAGATDRTFSGPIDDVRIYNRPLSAAEILAIYNAGTGTEAVVVS